MQEMQKKDESNTEHKIKTMEKQTQKKISNSLKVETEQDTKKDNHNQTWDKSKR